MGGGTIGLGYCIILMGCYIYIGYCIIGGYIGGCWKPGISIA
jgi:hypothetical protein